MSDLLELLRQMLESGITWATGLSVVLLYLKWYEGKRKKAAYTRMESKINALLLKGDIQWSGQPNESLMDLQSFKTWYQLYSADAYQAAYLLRRGSKMNKAWLITLVTYILAQLAIRTGVSIPTEAANWIVDGLMLLIPIALAFMSKTKQPKEVTTNNGYATQYPTDTESSV